MSRPLASALSMLLLAGCSVVGVRDGTEEPKYRVLDRVGEVEIREYGPRIAAETSIEADELAARNAGFRRVAGYIFGGNKTQAKIAMTAPVSQSSEKIAMTAPVSQTRDEAGRWVIRFFMPAGYTMGTLPTPNDPAVRLVEVPAETIAVLRFTGLGGVSAVAEKREALLGNLRTSRYRTVGLPMTWFYDPPWTVPFLRRNEVAVGVTPQT